MNPVFVHPLRPFWLPEPMLTPQSENSTDLMELADSLSIAFLTVLERLSPIERAVFLLRDVFDYDYDEISQMVGNSSTNCRQILRRAKQHLADQRPRFPVSRPQQEQITAQFLDPPARAICKIYCCFWRRM